MHPAVSQGYLCQVLLLLQGHYDELWGLCPVYGETAFITAGKDYSVIKWDSATHKPIWITSVEVNQKDGQPLSIIIFSIIHLFRANDL